MKRVLFVLLFISIGCQNNSNRSDSLSNKGVGPITNVILEDKVNISMANSGEKLFNQLCTSCHMINEDYIGPAMSGILGRRSPEWIMNMILNPIQMLEDCLLYTSPSPRDGLLSRMPSSACKKKSINTNR